MVEQSKEMSIRRIGIEVHAIIKMFVNELESITKSYWTEDIVSIKTVRARKRADQFIKKFNDCFNKHLGFYNNLMARYVDLQTVEKKQLIEFFLQKYVLRLDKICMDINDEAFEIINEIEKENISYQDMKKLKILSNIKFLDIEEGWMDEINPLEKT